MIFLLTQYNPVWTGIQHMTKALQYLCCPLYDCWNESDNTDQIDNLSKDIKIFVATYFHDNWWRFTIFCWRFCWWCILSPIELVKVPLDALSYAVIKTGIGGSKAHVIALYLIFSTLTGRKKEFIETNAYSNKTLIASIYLCPSPFNKSNAAHILQYVIITIIRNSLRSYVHIGSITPK